MLAWTIYISFIGVLVLMLLPRDNARAARIVALLTAILGCGVAFVGAIQQTNPGEVTTIVKAPWIPSIGANYYLAADGISLVLVVLTGLAAVSGILFSWNIEKRTKEFFAFFLALIGGVYGVFLSFDVLLLFAVIGHMVYSRTHTYDFNDLESLKLGKMIPFAGVTFVIAGIASIGLPGFSGFIAELQVLMGAWMVFPKLTILSGVGILIGVAYTLRAVQKGFYSDAPPAPAYHDHPLEPISMPERFGAVMLIGASLIVGLFPGLLMNWIEPCFKSPLFERLLRGGN